ncbi:nucleotide 5'-monophosphate nucleosidase PpnN [Echinimonas agarilytica]|uniref:Pyrimidine/purine nucleotide 5'-monophosphate nucleosidase n=1 Tax=Echinimonas agarilytica TaxID=1215918 RepID=A0AA41W544_9GAMM|nr:nucleotide 5'-monophosphate nucleosidase PpnN [Echinimonas agarilytica]MCM2679107.1 nucleotide 5'-monophosphate nucleosidase PpnN [Echinimonas agarilytica]
MITQINPVGAMDLLSQLEVDRLKQTSTSDLYRLFRNCCLAVLNVGAQTDNSAEILDLYKSFDINVLRRERGIKLELLNPPDAAFVDGELIRGIQEHLFSVLRDILYVANKYQNNSVINLTSSNHITHVVFDILRNARAIHSQANPDMIVCWGGHSIKTEEFSYTRAVGFQLGLRKLNIVTGCGPGAMEGPMKGAAIGHAQQRATNTRYLGLTEPSIIAAEPPNPIVNELVIMPDIEKRLEAFVRLGHGVIIFPGGAGTAEELLYLLGILLHPNNANEPLPVVLTGPKSSEAYFNQIDEFIGATLGAEAQKRYKIIVDDPLAVARYISDKMVEVRKYRKSLGDAYHFNWSLHIEPEFQLPFEPDHSLMSSLDLHFDQPAASLASDLRKAFSGIVAGNVKEGGIKAIEKHGPFKLDGDKALMKRLDVLLQAFVDQGRMKLPGSVYHPCYEVLT